MNGNNLDDHLGNGVIIENTYGSVVSGNMIEECAGTAIILDRDCYGITLSANVIAHNFSGGIDLRDAWGCAVSANTFTLDDGFGVKVGPAAGRIPISGNAFCDSHHGEAAKRPQEGNFGGGASYSKERRISSFQAIPSQGSRWTPSAQTRSANALSFRATWYPAATPWPKAGWRG
jgi:hypothetical protein